MKKILFLVLSILLVYTQLTSAQLLTGFGIKGGMTFSNQKHDFSNGLDFENNFIHGFSGSIFGEFLNYNNFNLILETGYEQRGYGMPLIRTDEFGNVIGEDEFKYRTKYIFASLGAKLKYKSRYITPYLLLQPRIDFYLGYSQKLPDDFPEHNNLLLEDFKKVMFGVGIGAGIEFNRLLPYKVFVEANYNPGLITSYSNAYLKVKEHSFNFKLGINFIKDKKKKSK
jgi:hypothetical protein